MLRRALVTVTTTAAVCSALLGASGAADGSSGGSCQVAAHRGDHVTWTENSAKAALAAAHDGADYVEMDAQVTKDGQFVLMHDRTVNRTTRGSATGTVTGKTYAQIRAMRLNDGQHVPTLAAVLSDLHASHTKAMVELKWIPTSRWGAFARVLWAHDPDRVVVNSFSRYVLAHFHAAYPRLHSALDADRAISLTDARSFGGVMLSGSRTTAHWRDTMRAHGMPVYVWGAERPAQWSSYAGKVTAVITNHPRAYLAWRSKHCRS